MERKSNKDNNLTSLLGEATKAKAAGFAYSLVACLPVLFIIAFFILVSSLVKIDESMMQEDWYIYASFLIVQAALAVTVGLTLKYENKPLKLFVKEQKCHPKYFLLALLLQIGLLSLSQLNSRFLEFLGKFGYESAPIYLPSLDGFGFIGVFLVVAVLPALLEETVFRGILLSGVKSFGSVGAVLLCGGLFSLYHQNPAQTAYQFCCGAAYALVALRAGSVLPTMAAHLFNNGLILTLTKINGGIIPASWLPIVMSVSALCLIAALGFLLFLDKQPPLKTEKSERKHFFLYASVGIVVCLISWLSTLFTGI